MVESSSTCRRDGSVARTEISLLEMLQGVIERTYDLQTGVRDIGRYVIGDEGYRRIYGAGRDARLSVGAGAPPYGWRASTLVRQSGEGLALSIYYPDELIACLERHHPTRRLDEENVEAFSVLVEELDHFLMIVERFRCRASCSLLELELHANITKHLMLNLFVTRMRGAGRLDPDDAAWIDWQLYHRREFSDPDREVRERYRHAGRLAARYMGWLAGVPPVRRPSELRRFHRLAPQRKVAWIQSLAPAA